MSLERPESGYTWLHVPLRESVLVVVCGEVHTWWSHWARLPQLRGGQPVRCVAGEGAECSWCAGGSPRRARYVFPVLLGAGVRVVELGRVQYPMLRMCVESGVWVGRRLRLERAWAARNAPIELQPAGQEVVSVEQVVDVEELVSGLGIQGRILQAPPAVRMDGGARLGPAVGRARQE